MEYQENFGYIFERIRILEISLVESGNFWRINTCRIFEINPRRIFWKKLMKISLKDSKNKNLHELWKTMENINSYPLKNPEDFREFCFRNVWNYSWMNPEKKNKGFVERTFVVFMDRISGECLKESWRISEVIQRRVLE